MNFQLSSIEIHQFPTAFSPEFHEFSHCFPLKSMEFPILNSANPATFILNLSDTVITKPSPDQLKSQYSIGSHHAKQAKAASKRQAVIPIMRQMYGIFTYIQIKFMTRVGKYLG